MSTFMITVPEPCPEDWEQMRPDGCGRFCATCSKTVIDFTTFSDEALAQYFSEHRTIVCGQFSPHQLNRQIPHYQPQGVLRPAPYALPMALRCALLSLLPLSLQAAPVVAQQEQQQIADPSPRAPDYPVVAKGMVTDELGQALAGARVQVKGTSQATLTDADGHFSIPVYEGSILVFSAAGKASQQREITSANKPIHVQLTTIRSVELETVEIKGMPRSNRWVTGGAVSLVSSEAIAIHGISTHNPLVILDGRPLAGGEAALSPLSAYTVRRLTIPEGMALYGISAAHGVIVAETKKPGLWQRMTGFLRKKNR